MPPLGYFATPVGDMFSDSVLGYQMVALHALGCPPNLDTDMVAKFLLARQQPNGEWKFPRASSRPPVVGDNSNPAESIEVQLMTDPLASWRCGRSERRCNPSDFLFKCEVRVHAEY